MNADALHDSLRRLAPHVDIARIAVTGGVAIGIHVEAACGEQARGAAAEDVDFVAQDIDAVRATVIDDFLVSHFHAPQPDSAKFMIQLVDPVTRLRLDFFPDALRALTRAFVVPFGDLPFRVLEAADLLDHKIALLSKASAANRVDAKHYADAARLGTICGRAVPPIAASQLATTAYSQDVGEVCARCEVSRRAGFPLAPKQRRLRCPRICLIGWCILVHIADDAKIREFTRIPTSPPSAAGSGTLPACLFLW